MRTKLIYIAILAFMSFGIVTGLQYFKRNNKNNNFTRKFKNLTWEITNTYFIPRTKIYFADTRDNQLYFKELFNIHQLFSMDLALTRFKVISLNNTLDSSKNQLTTMYIARDTINIINSQTSQLTQIIKKTNKVHTFKNPNQILNHARVISKQSIVGRGLIMKNGELENSLLKVNYSTAAITKSYQPKKQGEGFFSTDGMIHYDFQNSKIFFTFFYRGEFLCLDTNMNLLYTKKMIDTVTTADIKIAKSTKNSGNNKQVTLTQSKPPKVVNRNFIIHEKNLYIMSALKADNENFSEFNDNQVIDVYATDNGKYNYSFYLPKFKNKKLREFRIINDNIYATFDNYIVRYKSSN